MLAGIPCTFANGETIFEQGAPAADFYIITSGHVRIVRQRTGEPIELAVLGPGEFFGEMGVFDPGPRTATAIAKGETEVDIIDRADFIGAVDEPIVWALIQRMSVRLRRMDELLTDPPSEEADRYDRPTI